MNIIDTLITDRSAEDLRYVETLAGKGFSGMTQAEKTAWLSGLKGSYNATDLNRVGNAIQYISEKLYAAGYSVQVKPKTDWRREDIPTPEQMKHYLDDVEMIRKCLAVFPTTPDVPPDMENLVYSEANAIEQILVDLERITILISYAYRHCGVNVCGIVGGLIK